jgi:hypothetical protein
MWLANQACFSFVIVLEARVEGSSATCGIEVGNFRVLLVALFRSKGYFRDDVANLNSGTGRGTLLLNAAAFTCICELC